jgi:PAS domain S-box-containing protein
MYHDDPTTAQIILDSVSDGVFTVDREWRITSFNDAAAKITGVPHERAIGSRCCDVFRASICENECALRQTMATGQPIVNHAIYIIDANGRKVPISISTAIIRNDQGDIVGGVETFRDLSVVEDLRREIEERYSLGDIIGRSPVMRSLFERVHMVAESDSTVLIRGHSGTGKELFARAIHDLSPRRRKKFVAINCGALPDTLLESELFGHTAGAFTDARRSKPGRFVVADGGTIFLDEIGDISPAMQVRLLRVLQERVVEPLGSVQPVTVDVRVVTATHRDLGELVREGRFRDDLYYRINVFQLDLPALAERREDIPLLTEHFVARFNARQGKDVAGVSDEVMQVFMRYGFPGNVRELENIIEHAFVLCRSGLIELQHLPGEIVRHVGVAVTQMQPGVSLESIEAIHIAETLRRHSGNRKKTAEELGIHPTTLRRKIRRLGIEVPEHDGRRRETNSSE